MTMTEKELQQAGETVKQVHLSTVISKRNIVKGPYFPKYKFQGVTGKICTISEVIILPFLTNVVKGIANLMTHSKCMNVVVMPVMDIQIKLPQPVVTGYYKTMERQN